MSHFHESPRASRPAVLIVALLLGLALTVVLRAAPTTAPSEAQPAAGTVSGSDAEAQYEAELAKRVDAIVDAAGVAGTKAERVHATIADHYRALRRVHDARDERLKSVDRKDEAQVKQVKAEADAQVKPLHDAFVAKLSEELTDEQVEAVKDKMTYNVVHVTYTAFCDMIPSLTEEQKAHILAHLKEAREIAMDQGSSKDKHAVFGKYKGRINNYLSKQGYDLKQANKDWAERRKARESAARQEQPAATQQAAN